MQLFQKDWWSAFKLWDRTPACQHPPLIHSFKTAGTQFPILTNRLENERWLAGAAPESITPPIHIGMASSTGMRKNNEDTALVFMSQIETENEMIPVCFAVVADGIGGRWGGEYASSIAAETLAECVIDEIIMKEIADKSASPCQETIHDALVRAMTAAHEIVQFHLPEGGSTATCVLIVGAEAQIAHVGDSRAYLMNAGELQLLTSDHSLSHMLEEEGDLTPAQAREHARNRRPTKTIGMQGDFEVDSFAQPLEPASLMLLCTDGLWNALEDPMIANTIINWGEPQTVCDRLVAAGASANGSNNVTAVILQTSG